MSCIEWIDVREKPPSKPGWYLAATNPINHGKLDKSRINNWRETMATKTMNLQELKIIIDKTIENLRSYQKPEEIPVLITTAEICRNCEYFDIEL